MKKEFLEKLKEFVAIQSVSTDPTRQSEILRGTEFLSAYLLGAGMKVQIVKGYENPIVIARTPFKKDLQTVLVYGHYDVQPAQTVDQFVLTEKKGKLYGRGVADNKAQILIHMYSVIQLLKENKLNYNVIFLIEGNEETGSARLEEFVKENRKVLTSDCILVSDSELATNNKPAIEISFRGSANFEVTLETGKEDVHSGLFGGVTPNAAEELGKIVGSLTEFVGRKNGFKVGTKKYEDRRTLEATVEVTGFSAGYVGKGFRNSIPSKASAKINVRSAPHQDITKLLRDVQKFIKKQTPKYARVSFVNDRLASGSEFDIQNIFAQRAMSVLQKVYKSKPVLKRGGGTLPIASTFAEVLNVPQVMIPLADENCGCHSAVEFMSLQAIEKGLDFSFQFFSKD